MRALLIGLVLVGVLTARLARADCGKPMEFISQPTGSLLPPSPTLFYFVPRNGDGSAVTGQRIEEYLQFKSGDGEPTPVHVDELPGSPLFQVFRIRVEIASGELLFFTAWNPGVPRYRYTILQPKESPNPKAVSVMSSRTHPYYWPCSHTLTTALELSVAAPAYRIEWADTEQDFREGKRRSFVVNQEGTAWPGGSLFEKELSPRIELGHHSCSGFSFEWKDHPIWVTITALFPNGTESPMSSNPVRIDPPEQKQGLQTREDMY